MAELVPVLDLRFGEVETFDRGALGHHDHAVVQPALGAVVDVIDEGLQRGRSLWNHDVVGAAGDTAHRGQPARAPAHRLHDAGSMVRRRGRPHSPDRLGHRP